jgi:hypothetical protein
MTGVCTENLGVEVIDANHTCPWRSPLSGEYSVLSLAKRWRR